MTLQFSTPIRNGWLNLIESTIGPSAILEFRTGGPPSSCAAAATGSLLATINLPADWMNDAVNGVVTFRGTWQDASIDATGTPGHFRIYDQTGTVCGMQGTCTVAGGGGDMTINEVPITITNPITVVTFTIAAPGA